MPSCFPCTMLSEKPFEKANTTFLPGFPKGFPLWQCEEEGWGHRGREKPLP